MAAIQAQNQSDLVLAKKTGEKTPTFSSNSHLGQINPYSRPRFFLGDLHMTLSDWQRPYLEVHRAGPQGPEVLIVAYIIIASTRGRLEGLQEGLIL